MTKLVFFVSLLLAIIAATRGVVLTKEAREMVAKLGQKCVESTGVSLSQVLIPHSQKSPQERKFIGCLLRAIGVVNGSGKLQVAKMKSILPKDTDVEALAKRARKCDTSSAGNDEDEKAYLLYECVKKYL